MFGLLFWSDSYVLLSPSTSLLTLQGFVGFVVFFFFRFLFFSCYSSCWIQIFLPQLLVLPFLLRQTSVTGICTFSVWSQVCVLSFDNVNTQLKSSLRMCPWLFDINCRKSTCEPIVRQKRAFEKVLSTIHHFRSLIRCILSNITVFFSYGFWECLTIFVS